MFEKYYIIIKILKVGINKIILVFICLSICFSLSNCTVQKLILKKDYDGALKIFDRKIMHHRNNCILYQQRSIIQILKKDYKSALEDVNKSIVLLKSSFLYLGINKYNYPNYNNRGLIYYYLGEEDLAFKDFETSLKLKKRNNVSSINKALLLYCKNEPNKAIEVLNKSKKFRRTNRLKSNLVLGYIYAKQGDCKNANDYFRSLKNKDPFAMKMLSCEFCAPICSNFLNYEDLKKLMAICQP